MRSDYPRMGFVISSVILIVSAALGWPRAGFAANPAANPASSPAAAPAGPLAPDPAASQAQAAAAELMQLQEDTVVLKAQLRKLDAQAQVAEREASLDRLGDPDGNARLAVLATQSFEGVASATLQTGDGSEYDVHAGDLLPDGTRVEAVRPGAVVVETRTHRRMTLAVATPSRGATRLAAASPQSGVPPIPTLPPLPSTTR